MKRVTKLSRTVGSYNLNNYDSDECHQLIQSTTQFYRVLQSRIAEALDHNWDKHSSIQNILATF